MIAMTRGHPRRLRLRSARQDRTGEFRGEPARRRRGPAEFRRVPHRTCRARDQIVRLARPRLPDRLARHAHRECEGCVSSSGHGARQAALRCRMRSNGCERRFFVACSKKTRIRRCCKQGVLPQPIFTIIPMPMRSTAIGIGLAAINQADLKAFAATHWVQRRSQSGRFGRRRSRYAEHASRQRIRQASEQAACAAWRWPFMSANPGVQVVAMDVAATDCGFRPAGTSAHAIAISFPAYVANYIVGGGGFCFAADR